MISVKNVGQGWGEKERTEFGEEKSFKEDFLPSCILSPSLVGTMSTFYWEGTSGAGAGEDPGGRGMLHRESCRGGTLSWGWRLALGKRGPSFTVVTRRAGGGRGRAG